MARAIGALPCAGGPQSATTLRSLYYVIIHTNTDTQSYMIVNETTIK